MSGAGYTVAAVDLPSVGLAETADMIRRSSAACEGYEVDISDEEAVVGLFAAIDEKFGPVGVVVNNAAYYDFVNPSKQTLASFESTFKVDVFGPFLTIRESVPHMERLGGGVIINIASLNAYVTIPQNAAYSAAKAALLGLTRAYALELGPRNIRVVSVSPGFTATPAVKLYLDALSDEAREAEMGSYYDRLPLGRLGLPEEIADACVFLASPQAAFITGSDLLVDGGMHALNKAFSYNP
jgi:NAD(P)-dependent dehydrogenase (short-subunit alcohol dehydrogenase family)